MAPVQKLGNIDLKKRTSQKFAFGFFTLLSYLVVAILFVILGFIIIKGGSVISWDFLTKAPEEGMTKGGIFPAIVGTFYLIVGSSIGRTRIGRNSSDPVHRGSLFPSPIAGKHLRPVHGTALSLVCNIHERNGYRSLPRHGIRNGFGVDCHRLGCQPAGKSIA